ncbi:MAG: TRZ/ATZ family hydrolase [Pseudomonadota bacterium]
MSRPVDLLIRPQWLVPVVPQGTVWQDHALAVADGAIVALGPAASVASEVTPAEVLDLPDTVLCPGLINAHTHSAMTLLRGVGDDLPLEIWLGQRMWPLEARFISADFVAAGTDLAIAEMLLGGTTCANDMYFFPDVVARQAIRRGFRMAVGIIVVEFPSAWADSRDDYFRRGLDMHDALRDEPLITTTLAPHAPYTVADESFARIRTLSDQMNLPINLHLHETAKEVSDAVADNGLRPFARLRGLGLINENLLAVHMTQLTPAEIEVCAEAGVSVLHCPESNLKLASGICPVEALRQAGVTVALGTDGAASNNDLDLWGEMRTAALIGKQVAGSAEAVPAGYALEMATINGARALGLEQQIGSLEVGKRADLVALSLKDLSSRPLYDVISQLVYAGHRSQVSHVWVEGQQRVREGQLVDFDVPGLRSTVDHWQQQIQEALAEAGVMNNSG